MKYAGGVKNINIKNIAMKQPEFTIEQIREFVKKGYQSVSAKYVRAALDYIEQLQKPIDAVTVENLDVALRMCQIAIHTAILDKIIRVIKVIQDLGGDISMRDISRLEAEWRASITPDLCCGIYAEPKKFEDFQNIDFRKDIAEETEMRELKLHDQIEFENGEQYEIMSIFTGGFYDIKLLKPDPQYYWLPDQRPIYYSIKLEKYKILNSGLDQ